MTEQEKNVLTAPKGNLTLRTLAMPADTNENGDIFGGWLLSQMDLAGAIAGVELTKSRLTTVAVNSMRFWNPVHVGDVVCVHTQLQKIGRTSISLLINAWAIDRLNEDEHHLVTEAVFTYVSIDKDGKPTPIKTKNNG